jgi:hypothetical protein
VSDTLDDLLFLIRSGESPERILTRTRRTAVATAQLLYRHGYSQYAAPFWSLTARARWAARSVR